MILESGMGQGAPYWGLVVDSFVSSSTPIKVVGYDRAGYGHSSRVRDRRTLDEMAEDLLHVTAAHVSTSSSGSGRVVLVGHSWGGPILRVAAAKLRRSSTSSSSSVLLLSRLAGLVLVDPSDELCPFYFTPKLSWMFWLNSYLSVPYHYLGLQPKTCRAILHPLPDPYMAAAVAGCTLNAAHATGWEIHDFPSKLARAAEQSDVGDLPVTVLSAGQGEEMGAEFRAQLNAAHRQRADACERGKFVVAEKSGHGINISEPEVIVREALALLGAGEAEGSRAPERRL